MMRAIVMMMLGLAIVANPVISSAQQQGMQNRANQTVTPAGSKVAIAKPVARPSNAKKWAEIEEHFQVYQRAQAEAFREVAKKLVDHLEEMRKKLKGDEFAEKIMNLESMRKSYSTPSEIRTYVHELFLKQVISAEDVEQLVESHLLEFDAKLAEIDNQFLINCRLDVEFDPASIKKTRVNLSGFQGQLQLASGKLDKAIEEAFYTNIVTTLVGFGGGEVGAAIGHELGKDANGNPTLTGNFMAGLLSVVVGGIAEEVASNAIGTKASVAQTAKMVGQELICSQIPYEGEPNPKWVDAMNGSITTRRSLCVLSIADIIGPPPGAKESK